MAGRPRSSPSSIATASEPTCARPEWSPDATGGRPQAASRGRGNEGSARQVAVDLLVDVRDVPLPVRVEAGVLEVGGVEAALLAFDVAEVLEGDESPYGVVGLVAADLDGSFAGFVAGGVGLE